MHFLVYLSTEDSGFSRMLKTPVDQWRLHFILLSILATYHFPHFPLKYFHLPKSAFQYSQGRHACHVYKQQVVTYCPYYLLLFLPSHSPKEAY
jgi:hypothetical protein